MNLDKRFDIIRSDVLGKIRPTREENQTIHAIVSQVSRIIDEWNKSHENYPYEFISPQGSTGTKQTHLRDASDIDLFIFLNPDDYKEIIKADTKTRTHISILFRKYCEEWIIPALKKEITEEIYIAYAEHPYVSTKVQGYDIDIVFSFILPEERIQKYGPITAVDRTYYHTKFVNENLSDAQIDDVRILKSFFKKCYSYGDKAPIARGGFIGYAAELMIYHFKNIWNVFKDFHALPFNAIDFFGRSIEDLKKITRFQRDFLIIIDPTDKNRNVAASISERAWIYCSKQIESFFDDPHVEMLLEKKIQNFLDKTDSELNNHFVIAEIVQISDSHYTKIRDKLYSLAESIKSVASTEFDHSIRFPKVNYSIYFNPSNNRFSLAFYTSQFHIDPEFLRKGPKVENSRNFEKFKAKHPNLIIKNSYSYVLEKRKFTNFFELFQKTINERMFDEIKLINISIPKFCQYDESLMALQVLQKCILPFEEELEEIIQKVIPKKNPDKKKSGDILHSNNKSEFHLRYQKKSL